MRKNALAFTIFFSAAILLPDGLVSASLVQGVSVIRQIVCLYRTRTETKREYAYINGRKVLVSCLSITTRYYANGKTRDSVSQYTRYDPYTQRVIEYEYKNVCYRASGVKMSEERIWFSRDAKTGRYKEYTIDGATYNEKGVKVTAYSYRSIYDTATGALLKYVTTSGVYNNSGKILTEYYSERDYASNRRICRTTRYAYYASGNLESKDLSAADEYGNVRYVYFDNAAGRMWKRKDDKGITYEYRDEDYLGEGYGRLVRKTYPDSSYEVFSGYYAGTRQPSDSNLYRADGTLIETRTYYASGNLKSSTNVAQKITFEYYDGSGNTKAVVFGGYTYLFADENYYAVESGHGQGRLINVISPNYRYLKIGYHGGSLSVSETEFGTLLHILGESGQAPNYEAMGRLTYINEPHFEIPQIAYDRRGNKIVSACVNDNGGMNAYIVKYDAAGKKLWSRSFLKGVVMNKTAVATDSADNVIAATHSYGSGSRSSDIYVAKYDRSGRLIWSYTFDSGLKEDHLGDVAVDSSGNVLFAGFSNSGSGTSIVVVKLDSRGRLLWRRDYGMGGGVYYKAETIEIDGRNGVIVHGNVSSGDEYENRAFKFDKNGKFISDTPDIFAGTTYNRAAQYGAAPSGRMFSDEVLWNDGRYDLNLSLGYLEGTGLEAARYAYIPELGECAILLNFYDEYHTPGGRRVTAIRGMFDNGYVWDVTVPEIAKDVELAKVFDPDGNTYWFLWDVPYGGRDHQYIVIENTAANEWNAYTFIPDPGNPQYVFDRKNWTFIEKVGDPDSLELPEIGPWPQKDVGIRYPVVPTVRYTLSRHVMAAQQEGAIEFYMDEDFYGGHPHEGRVKFAYDTVDNTCHAYEYFSPDSDRIKTWAYHSHLTGEYNKPDYLVESFYNERYYDSFRLNGRLMAPEDGVGRYYISRDENGIYTFDAYYEGTDYCAMGRFDKTYGTKGHLVGTYKNYYDGSFANKRVQLTLEKGSIDFQGYDSEGVVVDYATDPENPEVWIPVKVALPYRVTMWFIYDDRYSGIKNVVLRKSDDDGSWSAYTFESAESIIDMSTWTPLPDPVGDQTALVEEYWPAIDPADWPIRGHALEYPPLSSERIDEEYAPGLTRTVKRVDLNPVMETEYEYLWNYGQADNMCVIVSYDYNGDGGKEVVYGKVYRNGGDYNIENMEKWRLVSEAYVFDKLLKTYEYYDSGNMLSKKVYEGDGCVGDCPKTYYLYMDENFYGDNVGRLIEKVYIRREWPDDPDTESWVFSYHGDTDRVRTMTHRYGFNGESGCYEYYYSGVLEKVTMAIGNAPYYTARYADVDVDGDGFGRILEEINAEPGGGQISRFVYRDHYEKSEQYRYMDEYDERDRLVATSEYDIDGVLLNRFLERPEKEGPIYHILTADAETGRVAAKDQREEVNERLDIIGRVLEERSSLKADKIGYNPNMAQEEKLGAAIPR